MGQQCVECIRQANRGTRQVTGIFGGNVSGTPVVTYTLITLNVLVYVFELAYGKAVDYGQMVGFEPDRVLQEYIGVALGDWYRLLSSAFLHEPPDGGLGLLHILFNMWAVGSPGTELEFAL